MLRTEYNHEATKITKQRPQIENRFVFFVASW